MNVNDPFGFMQSSSVRGYNPNLVSSVPTAPSANAANMSDTERLAQLMQGNLAGQLDKGDKLAALSVLLRSVGRGSQVSPQQALAQFQQQKMQEVQGRIQIEQYRKAAERKAQLDALKAEYVSNAPNPQAARELQLMSDEDFSAFLRDRNKGESDTYLKRLGTLADLRKNNPAMAKAYEALISPPVMQGSFETGIYSVPRKIPAFNIDPALAAEMAKRGL